MTLRIFLVFIFSYVLFFKNKGQHIYYKNPALEAVKAFEDTLNRTIILNDDSAGYIKNQFNYILRFYPNMQVKTILVKYKKSTSIAKVKPTFSSLFKAPNQRVYKVFFSESSKSTLDSVLLKNLSFNSQLGLIANQISIIEDISTSGFFNCVGWYFKQLSLRKKNKLAKDAQLKTVEMGLGHQLLSLNKEIEEKLVIDNWQSTKGYKHYAKHIKNNLLKPNQIADFIKDMPVYVGKEYR
jgi:hypothetical protein